MKKSKKFIFSLLTVMAVFIVNAAMGSNSTELIDPGSSISILSDLTDQAPPAVYAMAAGVNLTDLNAALGAYMRKNSNLIFSRFFRGIQFESFMTPVAGIQDEYTHANSNSTELLQPFQCQWTPKGEISFSGFVNKVRQIKMDYNLGCIDELFQSYIGFLAEEGVDRKQWNFVKFIIQEEMLPKIREEIDEMSWKGVYAAPTPGTPGASLDSTDGVGTIIVNEITATNIVPIPTGAITASNILDAVETFVDTLPLNYRNIKEPIFMSSTNARRYWRDYRANFGSNNNYSGKDNLKVDATSKDIIGIDAMEGSDRFLHTTSKNLIKMYDKIILPNGFEVQKDKREINILTDFKRGYGFKRLDEVFVNDQA